LRNLCELNKSIYLSMFCKMDFTYIFIHGHDKISSQWEQLTHGINSHLRL